ncbi:MAG TPA: hypothetical protein VMI31_03230 [Fimbriimonadaceae bacterium]|nr:hypothetical protein [Fimbriimonadaceae bacterium]
MPTDYEQAWLELKPFAEAGQIERILAAIANREDEADRIGLSRTAIRHLAFDEWHNDNLDVMTAVADYAIAECERLGGDYFEQANVICYNTSANLCDCWADGFSRAPRHFEKGIEYAEKAVWFRDHLGKGPGSKAMAAWALGKHQQSLGRLEGALSSFRRCLDLETEAARESGKPAEISADAPDGYLIAAGYVALLERDEPALDRLKGVLASMIQSGGEPKGDAEIIEGQLRETAKQLGMAF